MTEFCFFDHQARNDLKKKKIYVPSVYKNVRSACRKTQNLQGVATSPKTGKLQYYYRSKYIEEKKKEKFRRMKRFLAIISQVRKDVKNLLHQGNLRERKISLAIGLANVCSFRVGSTTNKNPGGITTLKTKNFTNGSISFIGKGGKLNTCTKPVDIPESLLRKYLMNPPTSKDLNNFLSFYGNFTMKDFRTLNANRLYISHLIENQKKGKYSSKQNISTESIRETAKEMNHNITTLQKHYLHPVIVKFYLNEKAPFIFTKHMTTKSSERILHRFLSIVSSSALSSPAV